MSTTSGSNLASGPDRDTLYALCTLARHAAERHPWPADDVALVRPDVSPDGYIRGGIVVATVAAAHAAIGRHNDPAGRSLTENGIDRLSKTYSVPKGSKLKDPLIALHGPVEPRSLIERYLSELGEDGASIRTPRNNRTDPYWFVFQPGVYLWDSILEGEQGWWVSAGAYRQLSEGRGLWLWLKGQSQAPAVRLGAPIEIRLRLLHDKLGLHSRDSVVARRSIMRATEDIYTNVPGFLRGLPTFGRGMDGKVRLALDPASDHIASLDGKHRRLLAEATARRNAIDAGEIECRSDDVVRLFLEVSGRSWQEIGDPVIQLRHARLMLEEAPRLTLDEIEVKMRLLEADEWWTDKWDVNTVRTRWISLEAVTRQAAA